MKRNRKQNIRLLTLILILLLGIGFAALAANLKIDGTLNVSRTSWDVHFENVNITTGSVTANPAPTSDNTTTTEMTYTINFTKPGDYFEFTTDVVNDGTIDAMVDVVSNNAYASAASTTPITLPTYLTSTVTYADGIEILPNQLLAHNTSEKIRVRVEFKKDIEISDLPSSGDTSIVFKFIGDYKQADSNAVDRPVPKWTIPEGKTATTLSVGDEICLKDDPTQCFNFLHYDGTNNEDVVMLAKYNLKVGNICENREKTGEYTNSDPGYGLQSSEARGEITGASTWNGTVAFSTINYWNDNYERVKPKYGTSDSPNVYDSTYNGAPGEDDYSVAYYVEQYKNKLTTDYRVTIKDVRLLTYDEATDESIGCSGDNVSCPDNSFIRNTSFWLGSVYAGDEYTHVWHVNYYDYYTFGNYYHDSDLYYGVRPVIVISKSDV